jgi:hypothetical protein
LAPNAANSGVIYGFASTAKKHMKKDAEFLSMIERITEEVRVETKMSGGSEQTGLKPTRPAITSSASKGRQPEKTPVNNSDGSPTVQESCMYALIQMGHKPETIASAFGTDLAGIYQAIGHVTMHLGGGNAQVCSAIRVAANL